MKNDPSIPKEAEVSGITHLYFLRLGWSFVELQWIVLDFVSFGTGRLSSHFVFTSAFSFTTNDQVILVTLRCLGATRAAALSNSLTALNITAKGTCGTP